MMSLSFEPKLRFFRAGVFVFSVALAGLATLPGWAQLAGKDSVSAQSYPWIRGEVNLIQFYEPAALRLFHKKWMNEPDSLITIAHFGDSHVQPDIYSGTLRNQLQEVKGFGGLGMMFPFSTAKAYATINYLSRHTGEWRYAKSIENIPKLSLGVSGATCRTSDPTASFTIEFRIPQPETYRNLKIFCRQEKSSYDMIIRSAGQETRVAVNDSLQQPYIEVTLPARDNSITIQLVKSNPYENDFEFYGMSLESVSHSGLLVHSLGIGGSKYGSLLKEVFLGVQLASLTPDLIILDFGTNDFLYDNRIPPELESQIERVISKMRKVAPQATVLLTTTQDMNRRGRNITAGLEFSELIRRIARSQKCPFYDWYWISGGPEKMVKWEESGLARPDNIHLTASGYTLKGKMLAEAVKKGMDLLSSNTAPDSLIVDLAQLRKSIALADSLAAIPDSLRKTVIKTLIATAEPDIIDHLILSGETLKSIAKKYKVKVDAIKKLNGLKNSGIIAGKYLKIKLGKAPLATAEKKPAASTNKEDYVLHKVQKGETLSELAENYKVLVADLKGLNGLKTSRIKTGQTLRIKLKSDSTSRTQ